MFTQESNSNIPDVREHDWVQMQSIEITVAGIEHLIHNLKVSTSAGIDNINSKVLKGTATIASKYLFHIFRQSLASGQLPSDWKIGKIILVHKTGDKDVPNNYRPISLTCVCCKMLEHIIASHIFSHLESNQFFVAYQHGFRKGLSCDTQLLEFTADLHFNMDNNL